MRARMLMTPIVGDTIAQSAFALSALNSPAVTASSLCERSIAEEGYAIVIFEGGMDAWESLLRIYIIFWFSFIKPVNIKR